MGQVTDAPSQGSTTGTQVATQSTPSSVKSFATNNQQPTYVATKTNNGMKTLPQTGNANPTIANAILDRLVHHSEIFKISGKSYRMKDYTEQHAK